MQILLVQGPRFHWQSLKRLLLIGPANSMGLQLCLTSVLLLRVQMRTLLASSILSPSCWTFDQMGALTTLIFFLLWQSRSSSNLILEAKPYWGPGEFNCPWRNWFSRADMLPLNAKPSLWWKSPSAWSEASREARRALTLKNAWLFFQVKCQICLFMPFFSKWIFSCNFFLLLL